LLFRVTLIGTGPFAAAPLDVVVTVMLDFWIR
jgi:hypothetical protein